MGERLLLGAFYLICMMIHFCTNLTLSCFSIYRILRPSISFELRERYDILSFERKLVTDELAILWVDLHCESTGQ